MFFFIQPTGESAWEVKEASQRARVIDELQPEFVTVLDIDRVITDATPVEELPKVKFSGPWYADIDAEDLDQGVRQFNRLLDKLAEQGVDLEACKLFATGGRGFHIEVPEELFWGKPKPLEALPKIYKEMAYAVLVDCLDMRVYSTRRGRMWRTPNVQRPNGLYKVQVTLDEVRSMDADSYKAICSTMRAQWEPKPGRMAGKFNSLFLESMAKVAGAANRKRDAAKDLIILQTCGGFPPSLLAVMSGEVASPEGFNKIALQIGITAAELKVKPDATLELCAGLIENHQSDGSRYNTKSQRRKALREMLIYTYDNPCYAFNAGAIRSLLPEGYDAPDLRVVEPGDVTMPEDGPAPWLGDVPPASTEDYEFTEDTAEEVLRLRKDSLSAGVVVTPNMVCAKSQEGDQAGKHLSNARFRSGVPLLNLDGRIVAYECVYVVGGNRAVTIQVPLRALQSSKEYVQLTMPYGILWHGNDTQTRQYARIHQLNCTMDKAEYLTPREGLDLIRRLDRKGYDVVWASLDGVQKHASLAREGDLHYRFRGAFTPAGVIKTDLHKAPDIAECREGVLELLRALLDMNEPNVIGNLLGWMTSCFYRRFYHEAFEQFPLLMVYGEAGSGKSTTVKALSNLFYHENRPLYLQTAGTTLHALQAALTSSASVPVFLDEYKPRQMPPGLHEKLLNQFRGAYNGGEIAKGGLSDNPGDWREVGRLSCMAPILIIAEAVESETAMLERTITVAFRRQATDSQERKDAVLRVDENIHNIGALGKALMLSALCTDIDAFKAEVREDLKLVRRLAVGSVQKDRVIFNTAVAHYGLRMLWLGLKTWLGDACTDLEERFNQMTNAVLDLRDQAAMSSMSEASKVLHTMAAMSHADIEQTQPDIVLLNNQDYVIVEGRWLDLKMRQVFIKYATWCRRKGFTPLFDDEDAFMHGLKHHRSLVSTAVHSPLHEFEPSAKVYRFAITTLEQEGVDPFKNSM